MLKVLVLGRGLVGHAVGNHLMQDANFEVDMLDKSSIDLRQPNELASALEKALPDVVIIAAGVVGGIEKNITEPYLLGTENARIILNTIDVCTRFRVKQVINLVPACVYPSNLNRRMRPDDLWTGPMERTSLPYSAAKILGVTLIDAARYQNNVNWISVIATNLYGDDSTIETHKAHVIPALLGKFSLAIAEGKTEIILLGDGKPIREFLHVEDFASAIKFILLNNITSESVINVSGDSPWTIKELADTIKSVTNFQGEVRFANDGKNGAMVKLLDGSKLHSSGWLPSIPLPEGIARVYKKFET